MLFWMMEVYPDLPRERREAYRGRARKRREFSMPMLSGEGMGRERPGMVCGGMGAEEEEEEVEGVR